MLHKVAILPPNTPAQIPPNLLETTPRPKPKGDYKPDKSQKRNLSTDSTPSPTSAFQQDQKHRGDISFDSDSTVMKPEAEFTLSDIMAQLKLTAKVSDLEDVAKKKDLVELQTIVSSHTVELQQIRDDLQQQAKRVQELETTLGLLTASNMNRKQPDVFISRNTQDGGPHAAASATNQRRKNLVFEGLPVLPDREVIGFIIEMCSTLGIVAFQSDFEEIVPLTRRDSSSKQPPILITFAQTHVRSAILRNKYKLVNYQKYATVFANPDEPIETRRAKAIFRRIGYSARQDGKTVLIRDDWIRIDDDVYKITDFEKIPQQYRQNVNPSESKPVESLANGSSSSSNPSSRSYRGKIKMTTAGLTFSGPSAFLSHMHKCPIIFKKNPYSSVEQGYHHLQAEFEERPDIAAKILNEHEPAEIKVIASVLPKSEAWNQVAPGFMWDLNEAKYDQNPDLKKELIATAPALLIEASVGSKWGGPAPSVVTFMNRVRYQVEIYVVHSSQNTETTLLKVQISIE